MVYYYKFAFIYPQRGNFKHFGPTAKATRSNKFRPRCLQAKASQESNQKMQSATL